MRRTAPADLPGLDAESATALDQLLARRMRRRSTSATLRLPGVLVRIALVYFFTSLIVLHLPRPRSGRARRPCCCWVTGHCLAWLPNPHDYQANLSPDGNVVRVVDRALIGANHMYTRGPRREDRSRRTAQHAAGDRHRALRLLDRPVHPAPRRQLPHGRTPRGRAAWSASPSARAGTSSFRSTRNSGPAASCCSPAAWRWSCWPAAC